jgi:hypothetical protein
MGPKPPEVVADVCEQLVREAAYPLSKHSQPRWEASNVHVPEEEGLLLSSRHQAGHGVVQVQGELTPLQTGEVAQGLQAVVRLQLAALPRSCGEGARAETTRSDRRLLRGLVIKLVRWSIHLTRTSRRYERQVELSRAPGRVGDDRLRLRIRFVVREGIQLKSIGHTAGRINKSSFVKNGRLGTENTLMVGSYSFDESR